MKDRWRLIVGLAGALFAINVIARLITHFGYDGDTEAADRISLAMFAVIGVVLAVLAFRWAERSPAATWTGQLGAVVLIAMVLTIFVGPFVTGDQPFADGAGSFFAQIWLYCGFAGGGALLGYLLVTALGRDHRSQSLKRYAELARSRPRRVVRR
jgi:Kef-type K+ transport system membrane component KefB